MNKLFTLSLVALLSLFLTVDAMGQGRRRGHPKRGRKPEMEKSVKKESGCTCQKKVAKKKEEGKREAMRRSMKRRRSSEYRSRRLRTLPWKYRRPTRYGRTYRIGVGRWH